MSGKANTNNQREGIAAQDTLSGKQILLTGTANGSGYFALNVNGTGGGGGGSDVQYVEGSTTSPSTGTVALGRNSTGALTPLQFDASNNLKVSGTLTVGGTTDEASWTSGTSTFSPSGGVYNDTATALTSSQQGTQRLTANRAIHTNLRNSAGTEIATSGNPLRIDPVGTTTQPVSMASTTITGTVAVTQSGSWTVGLSAGTNAIGSITNTSFIATQSTASALNATVVGNGTFVTQVSSLPALPTGSNTIGAISNTSFIATQATGTNLHTVVDSGTITATPPTLPSGPKFGQASVTTTASALASNALVNGVIIESLSTNTGSVFIGGTGVTSGTGLELLPGGSTSVAVSNTSSIFVITATGTATVTFIGS